MIEKTKILKITVFIVLFRAALPSWATRYNGEFFESLRNIYLYIVMNLFLSLPLSGYFTHISAFPHTSKPGTW